MSLVTEDGTGLSNSNAYTDLATATTYHADRNNTAWAAADVPTQTAALIKATAYIDGKYRPRWTGMKAFPKQALQWPRIGAVDASGYLLPDGSVYQYLLSGIPPALVAATCEAALIEVGKSGALMPQLDRGGLVEEFQVGPVRKRYQAGAPGLPRFLAVDYAIAQICLPSSGLKITR